MSTINAVVLSTMKAIEGHRKKLLGDFANKDVPGYQQDDGAFATVSANASEELPQGVALSPQTWSKYELGTVLQNLGEFKKSPSKLDCYIDGSGYYLRVLDQNGNYLYTRSGRLTVDNNYKILIDGLSVDPAITLDAKDKDPEVKADGTVVATDSQGNVQIRGQLNLYQISSDMLARKFKSFFTIKSADYSPTEGLPGDTNNTPHLTPGGYETSSVDETETMIALKSNEMDFSRSAAILQQQYRMDQNVTNLVGSGG